jgi:hypothetical protein
MVYLVPLSPVGQVLTYMQDSAEACAVPPRSLPPKLEHTYVVYSPSGRAPIIL